MGAAIVEVPSGDVAVVSRPDEVMKLIARLATPLREPLGCR